MKPPHAYSVPPAEGAGEEFSLAQVEQQINHTNRPWVFVLEDDLTTLKIALVTSNEWQIHAQERVFFPVLTIEEFTHILCFARRARLAGEPWNLRTLKGHFKIRIVAHQVLGGISFLEMAPLAEEKETERLPFGVITSPKGWTQGHVQACIVCGHSVVLMDTHGHPMHAHCERNAPCRSSSTS